MTIENTIRIVILEDEEHARAGLQALIDSVSDFTVVPPFESTGACLDYIERNPVDIAIVDLRLHEKGDYSEGLDVVEQILKISPRTRVIVATASGSPRRLVECFQAGAAAYVYKPTPHDTRPAWPALIRMVRAGGFYYDMQLVREILDSVDLYRLPARDATRGDANLEPGLLSQRHIEVLRLVAQRMTNQEVADELNLSLQTVKNHMSQVIARLGVETREQAVDVARLRGYLK